ncbi:MAG: STAS domain-containing protein [Acidobacteriota bacterium]|jgi:SulP family sulfate permease
MRGSNSDRGRTSLTAAARVGTFFLRPAAVLRGVRRTNLRPDVLAGLTVAIVAIPQSIAYAAIAGLPPATGLYAAAVASVAGALWGSSRHLSTGPTNAISLLVLSVLSPLAAVGSAQFVAAAGALAILVGIVCLASAVLRLGMLINFASRAVLLGFTAGAGVLIAIGQLRSLLGIDIPRSPYLYRTLVGVAERWQEINPASVGVGLGTLAVVITLQRLAPRTPTALLGLLTAGVVVAVVGAEPLRLTVVGEIRRALPTLTPLEWTWLFDNHVLATIASGAVAVAALGVVEAVSISREIARQSGDRVDVNQELVGQGMANLAAGMLGGYPVSGSFTRSAVNYQAGARTHLAGVLAGSFVLAGILLFGPLAAYLPHAALAGLILLIAWNMVDWHSIRRVIRASRAETLIKATTFAATLVLSLDVAILLGIILSLALYIYQSSMPTVHPVVPDETFRHFVEGEGQPQCPQLAVVNIRGALYFGAAAYVEDELLANLERNPGQHYLLLRLHGVSHCDLSGLDALEGIVRLYRENGGDVFIVQARQPVRELMRPVGFEALLGEDQFLEQDYAVDYLFERVLDPAVCCYECEHRVFAECQPLHKHPYDARLPSLGASVSHPDRHLTVYEVRDLLASPERRPLVVDVREPEEYSTGRLPGAMLLPLRSLPERMPELPRDRRILLVCRSGRRSARALHWLLEEGFSDVYNLKGGTLAWKAAGRPVEVE